MKFKYSLPEMKKAVVSAIFLAGAGLALILSDYDPSFTTAMVSLAGAIFAVAGVFVAKNQNEEDLSKAVAQLQGAALTVVGYFATVKPDTVEQITILVGAVVSIVAVYFFRNKPRDAG